MCGCYRFHFGPRFPFSVKLRGLGPVAVTPHAKCRWCPFRVRSWHIVRAVSIPATCCTACRQYRRSAPKAAVSIFPRVRRPPRKMITLRAAHRAPASAAMREKWHIFSFSKNFEPIGPIHTSRDIGSSTSGSMPSVVFCVLY